jgi:phosphatidylglycerol lysyltransferase
LSFSPIFLPVAVIEVSHAASALAGIALLFLARGLARRHRDAFYFVLLVLGIGAVTSLLKGGDWEEALIAVGAMALLWPARAFFYRRATVFDLALTPLWVGAIALTLAFTVWLGHFAFKDVLYDPGLLTKTALENDAARFLRALLLGAVFIFAILTIYMLNRMPRRLYPAGQPEDMAAAETIFPRFNATYANLAFLGDKNFLFDDPKSSFIMYAAAGRSWVAMGDPVAPDDPTRRTLI